METLSIAEYFARPGSRFTDKDAKIIGPEIERLGAPKAKDVVEAARPEYAPLHPYFEWDDTIAAEEYRKDQARSMIRSIVIHVDDVPVRGFESIVINTIDDEDGNRSYVPHHVILQNEEYAKQVIERAKSQLISWKNAYEIYRRMYDFNRTFNQVFLAIDEMESKPE